MPYISVKHWPKDEETKKRVVEKINAVFLEEWGCPPEALTIAFKEVDPSVWVETVVKPEIEPNLEDVMILKGEKRY